MLQEIWRRYSKELRPERGSLADKNAHNTCRMSSREAAAGGALTPGDVPNQETIVISDLPDDKGFKEEEEITLYIAWNSIS